MKNVLVAVMVLVLNWLQCPVLAQEVPTDSLPDTSSAAQSAAATAADNSLNLNLSSTVASMTAPTSMTSPVNVNLGGVMTSIAPGSAVTPAQMVALHQVMRTGVQSLVLDSLGAAQGGTMTIGSHLSSMLGSLTIPSGVTVLSNAASAGPINLTGNLVNSGSFYLYSTNASTTSASVSALNILNNQGAMLSTVLPATLQASLPSALSSLNLNLSAINNIVNAGTIASSGNLNLYAGGSISNVGANAVMQAMQSLTLTSMMGNITNSGLMAANFGNINVNAAQVANMTVNNLSGVMHALNGAINFRDEAYRGAANISLLGGDYLSQVMNLHGGQGNVDLNVKNITGVVNAYGQCVRIEADAPMLQLGTIQATGDPYVAVTGDLNLASTTYAPYLVAIAGQNIFTSSVGTSLVTGGGNLVLVAGAIAIDASGTCANCINVDRSEAGGDIFLVAGRNFGPSSSQNIAALDSSSGSGSGGNMTLIAFADNEIGQTYGGHIVLPAGVEINTYGQSNNTNGNLMIIAEAAGGPNAIAIGSVHNPSRTFATGGGGRVTLASATPNAGPGGATINTANGNIAGSFLDGSTLRNGNIVAGNIVTGGAGADATHVVGSINVSTGGSVTLGMVNAAGASGAGAPPSGFGTNGLSGGNGGHGGGISVSAGGSITTQHILSFGGGGGGGSGAGLNSNLTGGEGGSGGNGGNILITTTSVLPNAISITGDVNSSGGGGGGGGGGSIDVTFIVSGPGGDGGVGGNAGAITLSAPSMITVNGNFYAAGGGEGGAGGVAAIGNFPVRDHPGGGGGGGGGSYGAAGGGGGGGPGRINTGTSGENGGGGGGGVSYTNAGFGDQGHFILSPHSTLSTSGSGGGGNGYNQPFSNPSAGVAGGGGPAGMPWVAPGENGFNANGAGESGTANTISISAGQLSVSGVINAGNSLVEFIPLGAANIYFGVSGSNPSVLYLDGGLLSRISADTVSVGSLTFPGVISVLADTSVPYNTLTFLTGPAGGIETIAGVLSTNSLVINAGHSGTALQPFLIAAPNLSARSSGGLVNIVDNTSVNLYNSGAASGIVIDFHIIVPITGSSITIQSSIVVDGAGGRIDLNADGDIIDTSGATLQADNIILKGNHVGDADHPIYIAAGSGSVVNLSLDSVDDYIVDANPGENINIGNITSTGPVFILENGSITVSGPISTNGTVTLASMTGSNGSIIVNDTITAHDKIRLTADGTGTMNINAGILSNNADIILTAANIVAVSPIDAGTGTVSLIPSTNEPIVVNGAAVSPVGTFSVTSALLDQIAASQVVIGSPSLTGSTTLAAPLLLGGPGNYQFAASFVNNGPFNTAGNSITVNGRSFTFAGDEANIDSIRAINGSVTIVSRRDINFANIDTSSVTSNGGNITLIAGAHFNYGDHIITVDGDSTFGGSILQNAGGTTLQSFSGLSGGSGGKIVLVAIASGTPSDSTGRVILQPATVVRSRGQGNASGDVIVIAGADTGALPAVSINSIDTNGGTAGSGNIVIVTATTTAAAVPVAVDTVTGLVSADFCCGTTQNGSVFINSLIGNGESTLTLKAGNTVRVSVINLDGAVAQNAGSLVLVSGFALGPNQQEFSIGGTALSRVDSLSVAPGFAATTYGNITLRNNGDISLVQALHAESVDIKTTSYNGHSSGRIFDNGGGIGSLPGIFANNIVLTAEGSGPIFGDIGVTIAKNGNSEITLQASTESGYVNILSLDNVSIIGSSQARDSLYFSLSTATGSNASIAINHDIRVGSPLGTINLTADGLGTILRPNFSGTLFAATVNLATGGGDIGSDFSPIDLNAPNITFTGTGNIFLQDIGAFVLPVVNLSSSQTFSFRTNPDGVGNSSIVLINNGSNPTISAGTVKLAANQGFIAQQAPLSIASISARNISLEGSNSSITMTTRNNFDNSGVNLSYICGGCTGNITNIGNLTFMSVGGTNGSVIFTTKPDANGNANISAAPGLFIYMPLTDMTFITLGTLSTITMNDLATSSASGGGDLRLVSQGGDIITGDIFTDNLDTNRGGVPAGNVEITSGTASINGGNITVGNIKASSYTFPIFNDSIFNSLGKGGDVTLSSQGSTSSGYVHTGAIATEGDRGGGAVAITSEFADISTLSITSFNGARLVALQNVFSVTPNAGNVTLSAGKAITVNGIIDANSNMTFISNGTVSSGTNSTGGQVQLTSAGTSSANGGITVTGDITTLGDLGAGSVTIFTPGGDIQLGNILANNLHRTVTTTPQPLSVGSVSITTGTSLINGGSISVGTINTSSLLFTANTGNTGGDVTLRTNGSNSLNASIVLNGDITTMGRVTNGNVYIATNAGNVVQNSGTIITALLDFHSSGGSLGSPPGGGFSPINSQIESFAFQTFGTVHLNQTGDLILQEGSSNGLLLDVAGNLYVDGPVLAITLFTVNVNGDILNGASGSQAKFVGGNLLFLQASGTIGLQNDPIKVLASPSRVNASDPAYMDFITAPGSLGLSNPADLVDSISSEFGNFVTTFDSEISDSVIQTRTVNVVANSNVNIFQGGEQVSHDIQVGMHNTPETANMLPAITGNLPEANNAVAVVDQEAVGQSFAYCDAGSFGSSTQGQMQSHGANIGQQSTGNLCVLNQGNFLFQPHSDITVQVQEGSVEIPTGATALVMETGHDVAVFDISDGPKGRVRVKSGNKIITLSPGKQVVLTRYLDADFDKINPSKLIGYKNAKSQMVASDIRAYSADFSLPSVMMSVSPMKRMLTSDSPADRKLVQRMIKNAVVLSMLPSKSGPFKTSGH